MVIWPPDSPDLNQIGSVGCAVQISLINGGSTSQLMELEGSGANVNQHNLLMSVLISVFHP